MPFSSTWFRADLARLQLVRVRPRRNIDLTEVLDRARTPSLMAPFQVFFVRGVKTLFGRGSNEEKLAAIEAYCKNPNPDALLVFVADHISIPADARRMEMTGQRPLPDASAKTWASSAALWNWRAWRKAKRFAGSAEYCATRAGQNRRRRRPRVGGCARRRHDDGVERTGEADSLRRREETHHAGRCRDHGAGRETAVVI